MINIVSLKIDLSEKPHNSFFLPFDDSFPFLLAGTFDKHSIQNSCFVYHPLDFETIKTICCYLIRPKSCVWLSFYKSYKTVEWQNDCLRFRFRFCFKCILCIHYTHTQAHTHSEKIHCNGIKINVYEYVCWCACVRLDYTLDCRMSFRCKKNYVRNLSATSVATIPPPYPFPQ